MDPLPLEQVRELHQESEIIEERMSFIDQQVRELTDFIGYLRTFEHAEHPEVLASLGKGVFIETSLRGKTLLVDVGAGVLVKKNVSEVRAVITQQLEGLHGLRTEAQQRLLSLKAQFEQLVRALPNK